MDLVSLGKIAKIDRSQASKHECLVLPYVGLEHIEKNTGRFSNEFKKEPEILLASKFKFSPSHVLYGKLRPYLNKVAMPAFDGVCSTEILPILPNSKYLDRNYLWSILLSPEFVKWASDSVSGANLPRLNPTELAKYHIFLPPLEEQKRIARILEKCDRIRRTRRYTQQLSDTYLQSIFLEMFGDPIANSKMWRQKKLKDIASKFSDGPFGSNLKTEHYKNDGIRVIRLSNIGVGELLNSDKVYISKQHFNDLSKHECLPGDVIAGTLGDPNLRAIILPFSIPYAINKADCVQIRAKSGEANAEYICWLLNMPQTLCLAQGMILGQTRDRISMGRLKELEIPVPSYFLQEKFADVLQKYDRIRTQQREATRQAEHLFQTTLH
ncbi:MAG: restriction endonuclease subunit S, partial [Thermosynechococcaceae cyanobacterium]